MFLTMQFPIADSRVFLERDTGALNYPIWPDPVIDQDFVRSVGAVRMRWMGGLNGWVAEHKLCDATNAIRFQTSARYFSSDGRIRIPLRILFRRFYFDGLTVGKFEVGFWFRMPGGARFQARARSSPETYAKELLDYILSLPVSIPNCKGEPHESQLGKAGLSLANLYLLSSMNVSALQNQTPEKWWVAAGRPVIYIEEDEKKDAHLTLPFRSKTLTGQTLSSQYQMAVYHLPYANSIIPTWVARVKPSQHAHRNLRIFLLRLHAERETLRCILRNFATEKFTIEQRSAASQRFQRYLNDATSRISRLQHRSKQLVEPEIGEVAREIEDVLTPGERDAILRALENLDIRKNIFRKVDEFTSESNQITIVHEQIGVKIDSVTGTVYSGPIGQIDNRTVNTGGGSYVEGDVNTGGDFVGRDQQTIHGGQYNIDGVSGNRNVAFGPGARAGDEAGLAAADLERLFQPLRQAVQNAPPQNQEAAAQTVQQLQEEAARGKDANDEHMARLVDRLVDLVPGAVSAVVTAFGQPLLAAIAGPFTKFVIGNFQNND